MMAGGHVILARGADIAGNALAVGGRLDIDGTIGGDMRAAGRRVVIGGEVRGNVQVDALEVSILPTAHIHGNLKYRSPNDADIHAEAVIDGDVTFIQSEEPTHAVGFAFAVAGGRRHPDLHRPVGTRRGPGPGPAQAVVRRRPAWAWPSRGSPSAWASPSSSPSRSASPSSCRRLSASSSGWSWRPST